jgi:putative RNA 2'-phosphotransferase
MDMSLGREKLVPASKSLSYLLRHGAYDRHLSMDAAGWVPINEILAHTHLTRPELNTVVAENNKNRLQVDVATDRIRCCQGHSLKGTPVTREALEASWELYSGPDLIWHGTNVSALPGIAKEGLLPMERTHVHLAEETDSKVGKRARVDVLLAVSREALKAQGLLVFRSQNGVLLVRQVPRNCIVQAVTNQEAHQTRLLELGL